MTRFKNKLGRWGGIALLVLQACVATSLVLSTAGVAFSQQDPAQQNPAPQNPTPQPSDPGKVDIHVDVADHSDTIWYTQWWIWGVGVAVFLIVVVALTNRGQTA